MQVANRESFAVASRKRLPYDAEVEYLTFDGGSAFNSGISITDNAYVLLCDMQILAVPASGWARYFGSYTSESAASTRAIAYSSTKNLYCGYRRASSQQQQLNTGSFVALRFVCKLSLGNVRIINPATSAEIASGVLSPPSGNADMSEVLLGGGGAKFRCWGFRVVHNSAVMLDWTPVRIGASGAMYDRVSGSISTTTPTPPTPGPDKTA